MKTSVVRTLALCALAGAAAPAFAQDSVSNTATGLPGDALDVYAGASQRTAYVVRPTNFLSSKGNAFSIAPVVKSSKTNPSFFGSLISAQTLSNNLLTGVAYPSNAYADWNQPGFGVNPQRNNTPNTTSPTGTSFQLAAGFAEFSTTPQNQDYNGQIGALINYNPDNFDAYYVTRVVAAINGATGSQDAAQFGIGAIDASGNFAYRADTNNNTIPGPNPITGNNYYRTAIGARTPGVLNVISSAGGFNATTQVVFSSAATHNTPSIIPTDLAGRPIVIGSNFNTNYVYEVAPGVAVETAAHRPGSDDQRGGIYFSQHNWSKNPQAVGSAAIYGQTAGFTDRINLWTVDTNGNVLDTQTVILPLGAVTDNETGYSGNGIDYLYDHYRSQVAFRGGNSAVAIGKDAAGNILLAGVVYDQVLGGGGTTTPCNEIWVASFPQDQPANVTYSIAAYYDCTTGMGKPVNGRNEAGDKIQIGRIATFVEFTAGGQGPTLTAGGFDSAGNLYFVAPVKFFGADGVEGGEDDFFRITLLRGVYNSLNKSWNLEKLVSSLEVFDSQGTGLEYQIQFIEIGDFNSISSGAFWSGNVNQTPWADADLTGVPTEDPRTLGGVVLSAEIVYDRDMDGDFIDPTSTFGMMSDPTSQDEAYNTLLLIGAAVADNPCPQDLTGDGIVNAADLGNLLGAWGMGGGFGPADFNMDGTVNAADLGSLLGAWGPCP